MNNPNPPPPSIWKKSWKGPRATLVFTLLLSVAAFLVILPIAVLSSTHGEEMSSTVRATALMVLGLVTAVFFLRWLFHWRNLIRFLFALFCLLTLIALFYAEENWRGKRAWENYKHESEARGERFDVPSIAPPPLPDARNLAMAPLLKPLLDFTRPKDGPLVWNDTNGLARLDNISLSHGASFDHPDPARGVIWMQTLIDFGKWRDFYRGNTNYPQPTVSGTAAADVLVALGKFDGLLKELQQAAAARPDCRFPIEYDNEMPASILLRHLAPVKSLNLLLCVRATAKLELGQTSDAFADAQLGFRLVDSIGQEPILISQLVRISMAGDELQVIQEGLVRHAWNDGQLAAFDRQLAAIDALAGYQLGLRGEMSLATGSLEWCRRQGWKFDPNSIWDISEDQTPPSFGWRFMPSGWIYRNMITIARMDQDYLFPIIDQKTRRVDPELQKKAMAMQSALTTNRGPANIFVALLGTELPKFCVKFAWTQTYLDAGRVACAVERYRLATGKLPESLDGLVPHYLAKIPSDVMDGQPLRYQLKPDGGFLVYSIGWNKTDDRGKSVIVPGKPPFGEDHADREQGDWVWTGTK